MSKITLKNLSHSYLEKQNSNVDWALRNINIDWRDGGAYALLGPSGCGKTTLLNIVSGLLNPTKGKVLFDNEDITLKTPVERNIAQIFQFPVIYDTMTVYDNLAFPLKNRGMQENEIDARVKEIAEMLELTKILNNRASGLTADGKQKISLGRGLARSDVNVIMFDSLIPIYLTVVIGGITFTGSLIAYSKLSGVITGNPVLYKGQQWVNAILVLILFYLGIEMVASQDWLLVEDWQVISSIVALAFLLGVLLVIPIGGADMPVVIALLNSYSGLAACAAGFVIENNVLIVAGALVGASGLILTNIMCKAMNRSLANVLFSGFGSVSEGVSETGEQGEARPIISEDAYLILEAATSVAIVPGYGMAVAQAQHAVRELGELMEANGADVQYVIHPVAGRMPGHMNVLLAEANVPYDKLMEPEDINPIIETIDVCIVIGANDVVNPAAREDPNSPIFGMPIIDVDHAVTTFVLKRSMASGFAGIENPLFFKTNTRMLFGDAKDSITALVSEFKS